MSSVKPPDPALVDFIRDIIDLPDRVLQDCGLMPDSLNEVQTAFFQGARTEAKIKHTWLYYLLINPEALPALPPNAEVNLWKPEAEASVATLKVMKILYKNLEVLRWVFASPYQWWFEYEYEVCHSKMSLAGLIGEPLRWGKRKLGDEVVEVLNQFENPEEVFQDDQGNAKAYLDAIAALNLEDVVKLILSGEVQEDLYIVTPNSILWILGMMAAADVPSFREGSWKAMGDAHKHWNCVNRHQTRFPKRYLLQDGRIETFKKGRPIKQSLAELYRDVKNSLADTQSPDLF